MIERRTVTIREAAKFIGNFVSIFPATEHGPLYYRELEKVN